MTGNETTYLKVAVALNVKGTFTYSVPKELLGEVGIGRRVLVPFKNRRVTGYIIGNKSKNSISHVKDILDVLDPEPLFPDQMVPFFQWLAEYYLYPIGRVIQTALPGGLNMRVFRTAVLTDRGQEALARLPSHYEEIQVLSRIKTNPGKPIPGPISKVRFLEKKGWITVQDKIAKGRSGPLMRKYVRLKDGVDPKAVVEGNVLPLRSRNEKDFLGTIASGEKILLRDLTEAFSNGPYLANKWIEEGILETGEVAVYRNPAGEIISPFDSPEELHDQQKVSLRHIKNCLSKGVFSACLLFGVTGSGKTEVYSHAVSHAIRWGRQAIVMVPEIALAAYMEGFFRTRFGDRVAIYHSGLSRGEQYDQWIRMARGDIDLVIGARSALFAPLPRLGLMIVDEEHDSAYKQDTNPRYHARDAAIMRANKEKALVILGSGTPSVQSYQNGITGRYRMLSMPARVEKRPLPEVEIIDMKPPEGGVPRRGILSPRLKKAIQENLDAGNQTLLFLNRRGFNRLFICWTCGKPVSCPNCDVALIYHLEEDRLVCHYCGFHSKTDMKCPSCGNPRLRSYGFGTEKLEQDLQKFFPKARVARMDTDSTRKKGEVFKILKNFAAHKIDILVGTQMITKGYDFPKVTLVGVIAAELSLGFPDFRAAERTFQILAQVSGRAGRGVQKGRAVIQTFNPGHYAICAAMEHDFHTFFLKETDLRKRLGYPPFSHLAVMRLEGNSQAKTYEAALYLGRNIKGTLSHWPKRGKELQVLGPVEAPISKIKGKFRWQILIKGKSASLIRHLLSEVEEASKGFLQSQGAKLIVDVDPYQML